MGAEMRPFINNPFTFKINKHGEVMEKQKFAKEISTELNTSQYNIIPFTFPRESVVNGFVWKENTTHPLVKTMSSSSEYMYKGLKDNQIEISVFSKILGMEEIMKDSNIEGKYIFDSKTKTLISAERKMPLQMGGGIATFKIISTID